MGFCWPTRGSKLFHVLGVCAVESPLGWAGLGRVFTTLNRAAGVPGKKGTLGTCERESEGGDGERRGERREGASGSHRAQPRRAHLRETPGRPRAPRKTTRNPSIILLSSPSPAQSHCFSLLACLFKFYQDSKCSLCLFLQLVRTSDRRMDCSILAPGSHKIIPLVLFLFGFGD